MVLYCRRGFCPLFVKFNKSLHLFCLKLNISSSHFAPLSTRQSQVAYSCVEKSRDCHHHCPCQLFLESIREIHIAVSSSLFFVLWPEWSQNAPGSLSPWWCCSSVHKLSLSATKVPTSLRICHLSVDRHVFQIHPDIAVQYKADVIHFQCASRSCGCIGGASVRKDWCTQSQYWAQCLCVVFCFCYKQLSWSVVTCLFFICSNSKVLIFQVVPT